MAENNNPFGIAGINPLDSTLPTTDLDAPFIDSLALRQNDQDMDPSGRDNQPPPSAGTASYGTIGASAPSGAPGSPSQQSTKQDEPRPNPQPRATKPAISRRSSSAYQAPRRGQEFSVDDDADEFESDVLQRGSVGGKAASGYGPTLKRQSSNLRRRGQTMQPPPITLPRVDSRDEDDTEEVRGPKSAPQPKKSVVQEEPNQTSGEETLQDDGDAADDDDDDDDLSDAESFTLRDRQQAINETHPFGIRIWKPALYKKNRSVEKSAEGDIHSAPGGRVNTWLWFFNIVWTVFFGWWLASLAAVGGLVCYALGFLPDTAAYGRVLLGLAGYLFYPFGKFVRLELDEAYAHEDEGEGRSITEYEQWQRGDIEDGRLLFAPAASRSSIVGRQRAASMESADENDSLLGHSRSGGPHDGEDMSPKARRRRLFGRGQWTVGRVLFYLYFYLLIAPCLLLVSLICWFMVFWIPMGRVTIILFTHLRRHPLALAFHSDDVYSRGSSSGSSSILLCTYRAVGLKYWKYTVDGTNIFLINLIGVVLFVIFDYYVFGEILELDSWLVHPGFLFCLALFSIIPLAYFIGQAVASISAQSSMGLGAAINAFFSTVVEVFLYCVALNEGKGQLVEGSIIGSIFAGILFLPGLSMCFGATQRKTQRFNVKSATVTSTMLLFAMVAAFSPTLFYQIYGSHELNCHACTSTMGTDTDCKRCYFAQVPAVNDRFFTDVVRPYCWFAAVLLFLSYLIGLWFTLRTHAAVIWNDAPEEKKPVLSLPNGNAQTLHIGSLAKKSSIRNIESVSTPVRDTQLYNRILKQVVPSQAPGTSEGHVDVSSATGEMSSPSSNIPHLPPPKNAKTGEVSDFVSGLSSEQNDQLARRVAEMTTTAATALAREAFRSPRIGQAPNSATTPHPAKKTSATPTIAGDDHGHDEHDAHAGGGHDAPNWSRTKSTVILLGATLLYAIIAEILVNTVDVVLENIEIDEKFLGITLFALVPNTTEFLNAISFAMNGNIALSMEIGSAYALQVCLLQIPALVLYSAVHGRFINPKDLIDHTFNLIFPQWDMVTVILCVFLLSYMYGEGKSNYFKGSILVLAYLVIVLGFYLSGLSNHMEANGVDRFEIMTGVGSETFKTVGRSTSGQAF